MITENFLLKSLAKWLRSEKFDFDSLTLSDCGRQNFLIFNAVQNYVTTCRGEKIEKLCGVMGVEWPYDPDNSYELTTDNLMKILAIHMRFR